MRALEAGTSGPSGRGRGRSVSGAAPGGADARPADDPAARITGGVTVRAAAPGDAASSR